MYCSSCGGAVARGLSYCNQCGAKLAPGGSSEVKPELLVSAMAGTFILGLGAIALLVGVLKGVAGFDFPFLLAATLLSFLLMLLVEGVFIGLLLRGRRGVRPAREAESLNGQTTRGLGEAQPQALPEPVPSVTEHTTRTLEHAYDERKSK